MSGATAHELSGDGLWVVPFCLALGSVTAVSLLRTVESIATPCSLYA
ncbi:hypothetical protein [Adlercreutzia sp. ZJ305]|nr:hypothetical protein [Adlercreutzia sp. ZJ305]